MSKKIILLIALLFIITGCNDKKKEQLFEQYATDYYNNYMSDLSGLDVAIIDLNMLKKTQKYDLSKFKKCDDKSLVKINLSDDEIKNYEFDLICHK